MEILTPRSDRPLDVIYDGNCRFCVRSLMIVRRLARRDVFRFHDANHIEAIRATFPALASVDTAEAMFVVTPEGDVFRGFFAFRRMMRASPWLLPVLVVFHLPGASVLGPAIYACVARNRRRLGCSASCDLDRSPKRPEGLRS